MKTMVLFLLPLLAIACGDARTGTGGAGGTADLDTPRTAPPAALAGNWFTGTLSSIQYYDRITGEWANPTGEGFYWIFNEDGSYETGAIIDSTVYNCNLRLQGVEVGTFTVEGEEITFYRAWIKTHATNTCGDSGDREQGAQVTTKSWNVANEENGLEWLMLNGEESFHRWN